MVKFSMIKKGDVFPTIILSFRGSTNTDLSRDLFQDAGVILGVPGAFNSDLSEDILLQWKRAADLLKRSGLNFLGCVVVNDPYVLKGWARSLKITREIVFLSDANGILTKTLGVSVDKASQHEYGGGGIARCRRFGLFVRNGIVESIRFDEEVAEPSFLLSVLTMLNAPIHPELLERIYSRSWDQIVASSMLDSTDRHRLLFPFILVDENNHHHQNGAMTSRANAHLADICYFEDYSDLAEENKSYSVTVIPQKHQIQIKAGKMGCIRGCFSGSSTTNSKDIVCADGLKRTDSLSDRVVRVCRTKMAVIDLGGKIVMDHVRHNDPGERRKSNHTNRNYVTTSDGFVAILHEPEAAATATASEDSDDEKEEELQMSVVTVFPLRSGGRDVLLANLSLAVEAKLHSSSSTAAAAGEVPMGGIEFMITRENLVEPDIGLDIQHFVYGDLRFFRFRYSLEYFGRPNQIGIWLVARDYAFGSDKTMKGLKEILTNNHHNHFHNIPKHSNSTNATINATINTATNDTVVLPNIEQMVAHVS